MFSLNFTFMTPRSEELRLIKWLKTDVLPAAALKGYEARILKVADVPDDPEFAQQALSISLQVDFPVRPEADHWLQAEGGKLYDSFHSHFPDPSLHFCSLLEWI